VLAVGSAAQLAAHRYPNEQTTSSHSQ